MHLPRTRRWRVTSAVVAALVVCWLVACFLVVQHPRINRITRADAIVVLGPPTGDRIALARKLIAQGVSTQAAVSLPAPVFGGAKRFCATPPTGVTASCFVPSPSTTRGEAQEVARLAAVHHWHTIVVITSKYHVSRARMIFDRCIDGRVEVVNPHNDIPPLEWAFQYAYQTAGYIRVFAQGGC